MYLTCSSFTCCFPGYAAKAMVDWESGCASGSGQQYILPSFNQRIAYCANRDRLAEHFAGLDVLVGDMVRMDMQLIDELDTLIRQAGLSIVNRAKVHIAAMFYRLRSIPGVGKVLGLIMMYDIHQISRFPPRPILTSRWSDMRWRTCRR
jgi:hypothetical protein